MTILMPKGYDAASLIFPAAGMSIDPVIRGKLWVGSMPRDGSNMGVFGDGQAPLILSFASERRPQGWIGGYQQHYPLHPWAKELPPNNEPALEGINVADMMHQARRVADSVFACRPVVVLSVHGLNRACLVAGCALRLLGSSGIQAMSMLVDVRGQGALSDAIMRRMVTGGRVVGQ